MMDIERELEILIDKHKGKQVGLGEIRLDWFAEDCLKEIRRLKSEIARQSVKSEDVQEAIDLLMALQHDNYVVQNHTEQDVKNYGLISLAIAALQAYQPWVSVKDRLPEKPQYDWVLVRIRLNPDGFYGLPHIAELRKGVWYSTEYDLPIEQILQGTVTHWMPLPEPPKGE